MLIKTYSITIGPVTVEHWRSHGADNRTTAVPAAEQLSKLEPNAPDWDGDEIRVTDNNIGYVTTYRYDVGAYHLVVDAPPVEHALRIIRDLSALPADHDPDTGDLWDALHRIETLLALAVPVDTDTTPDAAADARHASAADWQG